ncbi:Protein of unknown function [Lactobacillus equicursoris 66c]|uniref:Uncharacterized protein n=1 Tax=Lactobacillus equicursoris 66c TaxID=872326 RepID=K0NG08_9LACO|nr:Protein of unknown function [Lactobacillus equicursoris 66c]
MPVPRGKKTHPLMNRDASFSVSELIVKLLG